jgi:hypothetical protein
MQAQNDAPPTTCAHGSGRCERDVGDYQKADPGQKQPASADATLTRSMHRI